MWSTSPRSASARSAWGARASEQRIPLEKLKLRVGACSRALERCPQGFRGVGTELLGVVRRRVAGYRCDDRADVRLPHRRHGEAR